MKVSILLICHCEIADVFAAFRLPKKAPIAVVWRENRTNQIWYSQLMVMCMYQYFADWDEHAKASWRVIAKAAVRTCTGKCASSWSSICHLWFCGSGVRVLTRGDWHASRQCLLFGWITSRSKEHLGFKLGGGRPGNTPTSITSVRAFIAATKLQI